MDERRWREDFPIEWEKDHYVTRREMAKFLTLGSALLASASGAIAIVGRGRPSPAPTRRIAGSADLAPGGSLLFRYPTDDDPCILLRAPDGRLEAYSQVCTHLSCAVVYRPDEDRSLFCPCHKGVFTASEGRPIAGPPTRRLPRIVVEEHAGVIIAAGIEV